MFVPIVKRIIKSVIVGTVIGVLFTVWANGRWNTEDFVVFFIAGFLLALLPSPRIGETTSKDTAK